MTGGVPVTVDGVPKLVFAKLSNVLADGEGHAKAWDWNGAQSLRPCVVHYNVMKKARVVTQRRSG